MLKPSLLVITLSLMFSSKAQLVDANATEATKNLYINLQQIAKANLLFGHEDALAYGLNENGSRWIDEDDRSDTKSITGSHPAVYGWDIGRLEVEDSAANIDDVNFERMKFWIRKGHEGGGIITISWHSNNPQTGGNTWDNGGRAVSHILPGADKHDLYKKWLDKVADFALDLKDASGNYIPILFRPYHEHTGSWFWWGKNACTADEYIDLWRFTVNYFRDVKNIHHFIYTYSPSDVRSVSEYLERYPGDDYVDVLSTDDYSNIYSKNQKTSFLKNLKLIVDLANQKGKISALTETGYEKVPDPEWFSSIIVEPIKADPIARQISYFLVWRNGRPDHYFSAHPGHQSANDLVKIYDDPFVNFENHLPNLYKENTVEIIADIPDFVFNYSQDSIGKFDLSTHFKDDTDDLVFELVFQSNDDIGTVEISDSDELTIQVKDQDAEGVIRVRGTNSSGLYRELMFMIRVNRSGGSSALSLEAKDVIVSPNPFTDRINVDATKKFTSYRLINSEGKIVSESSHWKKDNINLNSNLATGLYFLVLARGNKSIIKRVIKN
ncbi:MAG: T9SS type A sorting domain-containing protein [Cyclobacteriaceae bacterium]